MHWPARTHFEVLPFPLKIPYELQNMPFHLLQRYPSIGGKLVLAQYPVYNFPSYLVFKIIWSLLKLDQGFEMWVRGGLTNPTGYSRLPASPIQPPHSSESNCLWPPFSPKWNVLSKDFLGTSQSSENLASPQGLTCLNWFISKSPRTQVTMLPLFYLARCETWVHQIRLLVHTDDRRKHKSQM